MTSIKKPDFIEPEYQTLIHVMLIDEFTKSTPFEILYHDGAEERKKGYDIEVRSLIPLFLQLKVSSFYPEFCNSKLTKSRKDILGYKDNPGHYSFKLHRDQKSNDYLQHNLLCQLNGDGMYARYLAPLFYQRKTLTRLMYNRPQIFWDFHHRFMMEGLKYIDWRDYFSISNSIVIKPHREVVSNEYHYYAYNHIGEISFHSDPEKVENTGQGLFEFIYYCMNNTRRIDGVDYRKVIHRISKSILSVVFDNEARVKAEEKYLIRHGLSRIKMQNLEEFISKSNVSTLINLLKYLNERHGIFSIMATIEP